RVREAGLEEHIIFTGWVDRADMASFYGVLDIYFHAALLEPFGLIYPEAMMNAVPVVSTATGAALDAIVDGENGMLARERSPQALADALERLLGTDYRAVGKAGQATAMALFPFDAMWSGTLNVYKQRMVAHP